MSSYPTIRLKNKKARAVRNRHPWVFSGAIADTGNAQAGDVVAVQDHAGKRLGYGHYDPQSPFRVRMFAFGSQERDINTDYWHARLNTALAFRKQYYDPASDTAYRIVNAEGDNCPGIIIDRFEHTAVMQLRTPAAREMQGLLHDWLVMQDGIQHVYDKTVVDDAEAGWLTAAPSRISFLENGLRMVVDPDEGQKTGAYLDQRDSHRLIRRYAKGKRILDGFCYIGGFSLNALHAGAESVLSVDGSAEALNGVTTNVLTNFPQLGQKHQVQRADLFEFLRDMDRNAYNLIVLDPPAFTKHISTVKKAARGYKDLNMKAIQKIEAGGILFTFSCSQHVSRELFQKIVFGAAADAGRRVRVLSHLTQPPDHAFSIYHPEGEYLKGLVLQILD